MKISCMNHIYNGLFNTRNTYFSGKYKDCYGNYYSDDKYNSEFKRSGDNIVDYNDEQKLPMDIVHLTRGTIGTPVEDETLKNLHINSFKNIGNNCLKGGLSGASEYVKELKDYGIREFIMLCSPIECNIIEECEKHDMPITRIYIPIRDLESKQQIRYFENNIRTNQFVNVVKALRKGDCFVGCESGNIRTKRFLAIVKILDPECKLDLKNLDIYPGDYKCAKLIYEHLSDEEKKSLGYTEKFEKKLVEKIESNIKIY